MYLGLGAILLIAFGWWLIWSKLCDIEQKQFRMHDEMSLTLKLIEEQVHLTQSKIERAEGKILSDSQDVKDT